MRLSHGHTQHGVLTRAAGEPAVSYFTGPPGSGQILPDLVSDVKGHYFFCIASFAHIHPHYWCRTGQYSHLSIFFQSSV